MRASSILTDAPASDDFSRRQFLPVSAAVRAPRFSTSAWQRSALIREVLDMGPTRAIPLTPRPVVEQHCESIIMEGAEIRRTMRTGAHVVRQNSTAAIELDDTPAPLAFEVVADTTLQADAAAALAAINNRKPPARRTVPAPAAGRPLLVWVVVAVLAGITVAALVSVARALS